MRKITIPEWARELPDSANLTAKDVLSIFEYSPKTSWSTLVSNKLLPPPDRTMPRCVGRCPISFWYLGTLRNLVTNHGG